MSTPKRGALAAPSARRVGLALRALPPNTSNAPAPPPPKSTMKSGVKRARSAPHEVIAPSVPSMASVSSCVPTAVASK